MGIVLRNRHKLRRRDHIKDDVATRAGSNSHRSSAIRRGGGNRISRVENHARSRPTWRANIFNTGHGAGGGSAVRRKFPGENCHSEAHWIGRKTSVGTFQRSIGERRCCLTFTNSKQNIGIGDRKKNLIRVHQVAHETVATNRNRRTAIASYVVRTWGIRYGIGRAAEILVVG